MNIYNYIEHCPNSSYKNKYLIKNEAKPRHVSSHSNGSDTWKAGTRRKQLCRQFG